MTSLLFSQSTVDSAFDSLRKRTRRLVQQVHKVEGSGFLQKTWWLDLFLSLTLFTSLFSQTYPRTGDVSCLHAPSCIGELELDATGVEFDDL
jgi:hypothetical protein